MLERQNKRCYGARQFQIGPVKDQLTVGHFAFSSELHQFQCVPRWKDGAFRQRDRLYLWELELGDAGAIHFFESPFAPNLLDFDPIALTLDIETKAFAILRLPCRRARIQLDRSTVALDDVQDKLLVDRPAVTGLAPAIDHRPVRIRNCTVSTGPLQGQGIGRPMRRNDDFGDRRRHFRGNARYKNQAQCRSG